MTRRLAPLLIAALCAAPVLAQVKTFEPDALRVDQTNQTIKAQGAAGSLTGKAVSTPGADRFPPGTYQTNIGPLTLLQPTSLSELMTVLHSREESGGHGLTSLGQAFVDSPLGKAAGAAGAWIYKGMLSLTAIAKPEGVNEGKGCCTAQVCAKVPACPKPITELAQRQREAVANGHAPLIIYTSDLKRLTGPYLQLMEERVQNKTAHPTDYIYASRLHDDYDQQPDKSKKPDMSQPLDARAVWDSRSYREEDVSGWVTWWSVKGKGAAAVYHRFIVSSANDRGGKYFEWAGSSSAQGKAGIADKLIPLGIKRHSAGPRPEWFQYLFPN